MFSLGSQDRRNRASPEYCAANSTPVNGGCPVRHLCNEGFKFNRSGLDTKKKSRESHVTHQATLEARQISTTPAPHVPCHKPLRNDNKLEYQYICVLDISAPSYGGVLPQCQPKVPCLVVRLSGSTEKASNYNRCGTFNNSIRKRMQHIQVQNARTQNVSHVLPSSVYCLTWKFVKVPNSHWVARKS